MQIGNNFNPNVYAQQYANQNGLSLEEAKAQLRKTHGEPQRPENNSQSGANNSIWTSQQNNINTTLYDDENNAAVFQSIDDVIQQLLNMLKGNAGPQKEGDFQSFGRGGINGNNSSRPPQGIDPDTYAQTYATENNLSLAEAKAELKEKYGDPEEKHMSFIA